MGMQSLQEEKTNEMYNVSDSSKLIGYVMPRMLLSST